MGLEFSGDERPAYGSFVEAVGFTETDMYRINLNRVRWRPAEGPDFVAEPPRPTSAKDILTDEQGRHCVNIRYHGNRIALTGTVKSILAGDGFTRFMLDDGGFQATAADSPIALTDRQAEILESLVRGLTNKEIARQYGISTGNVKFHLAALFRRLNVSNRTEAVAIALRKHLLKI